MFSSREPNYAEMHCNHVSGFGKQGSWLTACFWPRGVPAGGRAARAHLRSDKQWNRRKKIQLLGELDEQPQPGDKLSACCYFCTNVELASHRDVHNIFRNFKPRFLIFSFAIAIQCMWVISLYSSFHCLGFLQHLKQRPPPTTIIKD